jgi:hypothetical protein
MPTDLRRRETVTDTRMGNGPVGQSMIQPGFVWEASCMRPFEQSAPSGATSVLFPLSSVGMSSTKIMAVTTKVW